MSSLSYKALSNREDAVSDKRTNVQQVLAKKYIENSLDCVYNDVLSLGFWNLHYRAMKLRSACFLGVVWRLFGNVSLQEFYICYLLLSRAIYLFL